MDKNMMSEKLNSKMVNFSSMFGDKFQNLRDSFELNRLRCARYVRQHPHQAVSAALGSGILIGLILSRLIRKK